MANFKGINSESFIAKLARYVNIVHSPVSGWVVLSISLCLTIAAYWIASKQVEARALENFQYRASEITEKVLERMTIYEQALSAGVALFNSSDQVDRDEWRLFVNSMNLNERLPGIQGMGYVAALAAEELSDHLQAIQKEGFPEYSLKQEFEREIYAPVVYIEPFDRKNRQVLGYDMWANDLLRQAMQKSRDDGASSVSGIIKLVQDGGRSQSGFLMYSPVYKSKSLPFSLNERRAQILGWVYASFKSDDLMNDVLSEQDGRLAFKIYDMAINEQTLLFNSGDSSDHIVDETNKFRFEQKVVTQGRSWVLAYYAKNGRFISVNEGRQPLYVLIAGVVIDILLFYVIVSMHLINRHAKVKREQLEDQYFGNLQNLAQQAKLIEDTEKESDTFFELAPAPFLVVSEDGIIVRANQSAKNLFGYPENTLVGMSVDLLIPVEYRKQHAINRKTFQTMYISRMMGGTGSFAALKSDGTTLQTSINLVPLQYRGAKHWVAAIHDVSAQKQIEQTLAEAKEKAEGASRSKSEFVANMSHEIRTPMNAVLGSAQLLSRTELTTEQNKYLSMIRNSGETLLGIINDILDFSKIEAGKMALSSEPFSLNEILNRLANIMSVNVSEKEIELSIEVEKEVPSLFVGDGLRLQQLLINLATNAIKFTEKGSVRVYVGLLNVESDQAQLSFKVSDSGIGMSDEQQKLLFKAFSQADTSITRRFGGTGLGLVICSKIVDLFNGRFTVKSEQGKGSEFSFSATFTLGETKLLNADIIGKKLCVAIVESNTDTLQAIVSIFERWNWTTYAAQSWLDLYDNVVVATLDSLIFSVSTDSDYLDHIHNLENLGLSEECSLFYVVDNQQQAVASVSTIQWGTSSALVKPVTEDGVASVLRGRCESALNSDGEIEPQDAKSYIVNASVLLVEDNVLNQTIASGLLEDLGASFDIANNGLEAVNKLKENPSKYDLVLMDIQMPIMDGVTATKIIRNELLHTLPIIALTAGVLHSEQQTYLSVGMNDFLPKPIDFDDFGRVIRKYFGKQTGIVSNLHGKSNSFELNVEGEKQLSSFNTDRMNKLAKGNIERHQRMSSAIEKIFETGNETLEEARQAVFEGNIREALKIYHGLKGVIANYGGDEMQQKIQQLEEALKVEELDQVVKSIDALNDSFDRYKVAAQNWIDLSYKAS